MKGCRVIDFCGKDKFSFGADPAESGQSASVFSNFCYTRLHCMLCTQHLHSADVR